MKVKNDHRSEFSNLSNLCRNEILKLLALSTSVYKILIRI